MIRMEHCLKATLAGSVALAALATSGLARAQVRAQEVRAQEATTLDDVVVTAQRREQSLQLGELATVVGRENDLHQPASACCCSATNSAIPFSARASSWSISARVKATPSAVPCTST